MGDASCVLGAHESHRRSVVPVKEVLAPLQLSSDQLCKICDDMSDKLNAGIRNRTRNGGIAVLPTFVTHLPDGTEKGTFLALDLGGTNFRVVKVDLTGVSGKKCQVHSQVYLISQEIIHSTSEMLFDHVAKCIADFVRDQGLQDCRLPLGFTFSFPCIQMGLNQSVLLRWTKGFDVSGVVGKDIVQLLKAAIERQNKIGAKCLVDVVAVINDTVGTLMSCAYEDQNCCIGMIVGTGTNACYMESGEAVTYISDTTESGHDQMCINTEWGSFGEDGSLDDIRTSFDRAVDTHSTNPGSMIYEKMISGMYLGDVTCQVLIELIRRKALFNGRLTDEIQKRHCFPSSFLTQIEQDEDTQLPVCDQILNNLGYTLSTVNERQLIKNVCSVISTRAAELCASGVSALIKRIRKSRKLKDDQFFHVTVAVDGTLYKKHPTFKTVLLSTVHQLSPNSEVTFRISYDGSGKGAALVSAVSCKLLEENMQ